MKLSDVLLDGFQSENSSPFDIKVFIYQYLRYWWAFVLGVVLCVSIAFYQLFYATPQYEISSSLLINVDKGSNFSSNAVFNDLEGYQTSNIVENELEVIGSFSLMRDAIEGLPLHASFFEEDKYSRRREIYGSEVPITVEILGTNDSGLLPDDQSIKLILQESEFTLETLGQARRYKYGERIDNWFGGISIGKSTSFRATTASPLFLQLNNKDALAAGYSSSLRVELSNKLSSIVNLRLTDPVPEKGKDILNKLVETYNFQAVKEKNLIATNTLEFIEEQLQALTRELEDIERKIQNYKSFNNISDLSSEMSFHVESTGEYESQLSRNQTQIEVLESIERYLNNPNGSTIEVTSSLTIEDQTLAGLVSSFNELQSERERLLRTTQPGNPLVANLTEQLNSVKNNILTNLTNIKGSLSIENRNLQSRVSQLENRIREVPEIERGLLELTREQGIKQEHYLYLVKKKEESALSLAATTVSNSRVIDVASASNGPVSPKKPIVLAVAMMMGLGIPFSLIFVKNSLGGKIVQKSDVQKITTIPIIAEISHNNKKEVLAISEKKRTPIAEQFRLLRTNLRFVNEDIDDKVILVTSSISGEGKTFFSLNLGVSLSLTGKKVVILEFDLRKPALLKSIFVKRKEGIADYLKSTDIQVKDIIHDYEHVSNLSIIGCGAIPEDPAELMLSPKVENLINELREQYDYVVLDTAPIGTVSDALNLISYSDYTLFVVRYNYTKKDNINFMEANLRNKLKRPYVILNDAKLGAGYYGYAYGYGYEDKKVVS